MKAAIVFDVEEIEQPEASENERYILRCRDHAGNIRHTSMAYSRDAAIKGLENWKFQVTEKDHVNESPA